MLDYPPQKKSVVNLCSWAPRMTDRYCEYQTKQIKVALESPLVALFRLAGREPEI